MATPTMPDLSALSLSSPSTPMTEQEQEDWDRELARTPVILSHEPSQAQVGTNDAPRTPTRTPTHTHPRNSVAFPGPAEQYPPSFSPGRATRFTSSGTRIGEGESEGENDGEGGAEAEGGEGSGKRARRTLSALLRLHSERGTAGAGKFSEAEAARIADVLGQWINSSSSPYESAADDFAFTVSPSAQDDIALDSKKPTPQTRPRGRSEGVWAGEAAS